MCDIPEIAVNGCDKYVDDHSSVSRCEVDDKIEKGSAYFDTYEDDDDMSNYDCDDDCDDDCTERNEDFSELHDITEKEEMALRARLMNKLKILSVPSPLKVMDLKPSSSIAEKACSKQALSIFTEGNSSSLILINELISIKMSSVEDGIVAEAVDDNIFHWRVQLHKFSSESDLCLDLLALDDEFGYAYVEIDLVFDRDAYPSYPPIVTIVRPRFQGLALTQMASMKCLHLDSWTVVTDMRSTLNRIKREMEKHSRLDLTSDLNSMEKYPHGSYSRLEHLLVKFGVVSQIPARILGSETDTNMVALSRQAIDNKPGEDVTAEFFKHRKLNESDEMSEASSLPSKIPPPSSYSLHQKNVATLQPIGWAKGTGYGYGYELGHAKDWDISNFVAVQKAKDFHTQTILSDILEELRMLSSECHIESQKNHVPFSVGRWHQLLGESSLIPFIEIICNEHSILELSQQIRTYRVVFQLLDHLTESVWKNLLLTLEKQERCLAVQLEVVKQRFKAYEKRASSAAVSSHGQKRPLDGELSDEDVPYFLQVLSRITKVYDEYRTHLANDPDSTTFDDVASPLKESLQSSLANPLDDSKYVDIMRPLQYQEIKSFEYFHFTNLSSVTTGSRLRRLAQDHAELSTSGSCMLAWGSSVWILASEERMDCMQVMISGPDGTPYSNGLFLFSVSFPGDYPNSPPAVHLETTGRGTVRFNPNLYDNGKVCLSLLGTWSGSPSEQWNPPLSTFRQVLLSIQSLILVPEPFYNEPTYEIMMHTPEGERQSREYNRGVRINTVVWAMTDHLKNPKRGFEEVIHQHFKLKKREIEAQLVCWNEEDETPGKLRSATEGLLMLLRDL